MSRATPGEIPFAAGAAILPGTLVLKALASTWRIRLRGEQHLKALRAARTPFVFSLWHGQLLPLIWHHRNEGVAILVSEHKDGEIIARVASNLGYQLIRGSTTRGGERALLQLANTLRAGREVAVTPDGPKGPARRYARGALVAAQRAHAPILPIAVCAQHGWHLGSWDSFLIPAPFTVVTIAYGEPANVNASSARDAEQEAPRFEALMEATVRLACAS